MSGEGHPLHWQQHRRKERCADHATLQPTKHDQTLTSYSSPNRWPGPSGGSRTSCPGSRMPAGALPLPPLPLSLVLPLRANLACPAVPDPPAAH